MPLLVKVMTPKGTLVVIRRVVTLAVQTLESVRTTSLPLTTTIVNSKIPNNSNKNPTLPSRGQNYSQHICESPDSLNLLSRASSKADKRVHFRGRP